MVLSLISPPSKLWFKAETSQGWRGKHNKHKKETLKLKSSSEAKGQISDLEEKPKDIMQKGKQIEWNEGNWVIEDEEVQDFSNESSARKENKGGGRESEKW